MSPNRVQSTLRTPATVEALGAGRAVVLDDLLGPSVADFARAAALELDAVRRLPSAGIGRDGITVPAIRGDRIAWIDPRSAPGPFRPVLALFAMAMVTLNETAYVGTNDLECQLAIYDAGSSYERHLDAIRGTSNRRITALYYLNRWHTDDGGELELYGDELEPVTAVEPIADRLVLFRSDVTHHAVRPVLRGPRIAISAFFRRRPMM